MADHVSIQCSNQFGTAMSFVGKPDGKMLAWLAEQVNEIQSAKGTSDQAQESEPSHAQ
jgi:hypothetical protein